MRRNNRKYLNATVSAIIERFHNGKWQVLLQERWKPEEDPKHSGLLDLPGGRIELGEDVYTALKREVKEECGLVVQDVRPGRETRAEGKYGEVSIAFVPFCGESYLGSNYVGFCFVCTATGRLTEKGVFDAREPRWVSFSELKRLLSSEPQKFFAYHLSTLKFYVAEKEKGNI